MAAAPETTYRGLEATPHIFAQSQEEEAFYSKMEAMAVPGETDASPPKGPPERPTISIEDRFVILGGNKRKDCFPIDEGKYGHFFTFKKFFDHHLLSSLSKNSLP